MSMEVRRVIHDCHDQPVLCVAYNPQRREIFTGSQDTTIKVWLSETGELLRTLQEHAGWVTGLVYANEVRVLFSCGVDGRILVWSKGDLLQKEKVGDKTSTDKSTMQSGPLYCLAWDARRQNLVAGANGHIWVYTVVAENLDLSSREKPIIKLHSLLRDAHTARGMEEPVRGIVCTDAGKLFSCGYDRSLCIWDTDHLAHAKLGQGTKGRGKKSGGSQLGDSPFVKIGGRDNCHEGAISAVTFDPDNNWVITGSFDRNVKIWAGDGKKVTDINGFSDTLTGLCYVPATKTLWMSANSAHPIVYDPRSATDITHFLQQTATSSLQQREAKERVQRLFRIAETGELLASTNTRALHIYRFNPFGACSILRSHSDWVEVCTYCYKRKPPSETGEKGEESMVLLSGSADATVQRWEPSSRMNPFLYSATETYLGHKGAVLCAIYCAELDAFITGGDDGTIRLWPQHDPSEDIVPPEEETGQAAAATPAAEGGEGGGEGGSARATPHSARAASPPGGGEREAPQLTLLQQQQAQQASQQVLRDHSDRITGLVCHGTTLASVSWDLSLMLWDLAPSAHGARVSSTHVVEMAHDDYILSVAYAAELGQYATCAADQGVKIWDAAVDVEPGEGTAEGEAGGSSVPEGKLGKRLVGVLLGHTADVSHVAWNSFHRQWVTGSADQSVRLWSADGACVAELRPPGDAITALEIDQLRGLLIVASMDRAMRVYEPTRQELVQVHHGHSDAVRCIVHVPEKEQYITASWDHTIRVWRAYKPESEKKGKKGKGGAGAVAAGKGGDEDAAAAAAAPSGAEGGSHPGGGGGPDEASAEAAAAAAAAAEAFEEERVPTYAELHPLREPKCLSDRTKGAAESKFLKKVSTEDSREKRKKKQAEEEMAAKSVNGLSLKLAELEHSLKTNYERQEKPPSKEDKRGGRAFGAARGVRGATGAATGRAGAQPPGRTR